MAKSSPLSGRIGSRFGGRGARKRTRIIVASLFIIVAGSFATTLAANVTITGNRGNALEFGQGQVPAIACDTSVTTAITEEWNYATTLFHVKTITLSDLNITRALTATSNNGGCGDKTLQVGLLKSDGTALNVGSGDKTQISFTVPTAAGSATNIDPSGATVVIESTSPGYKAIITLPTPSPSPSPDIRAAASDVARVTLETD